MSCSVQILGWLRAAMARASRRKRSENWCAQNLSQRPTEIDPASNLIPPNDDQQIADTILTARRVYRLFPEAVVTGDQAFETGLRNIATEQCSPTTVAPTPICSRSPPAGFSFLRLSVCYTRSNV
jgi:hypothetical protein